MVGDAMLLALILLTLFARDGFSLFEPRANDDVYPRKAASVLPELRNYGLFDRPPAPVKIDNRQPEDARKDKGKRQDTMTPVPAAAPITDVYGAATDTGSATMAPAAAGTTPYAAPDYPATDILSGAGLTDTYALPPAYDDAALSSLLADDSSYVAAASSLLSAFPTEGVVCSGVEDVDGAKVTICGPTGEPRVAGVSGLGDGLGSWRVLAGGSNASWAFVVLGGLGGIVVFFL